MNAFELNKIVGSLLMATLVSLFIGYFSDFLVSPHQLEHPVFAPAAQAPQPAAAGVAVPAAGPVEAIEPLLAAASVDAGRAAFRQCASCHTVEKGGRHGIGPALWDVVGRVKGGAPGYNYSAAMQAAGQAGATWTYEDLNRFIANPREAMPGTKMGFSGVRRSDERANLAVYLRTLADTPKPLP